MNRTMKYISLLLLLLCGGVAASADNAVTLSSVSGVSGSEVTVSVSMTNTDAVTNLQLSIPLDEGLSFVEGSVAKKDRLKKHSVSAGVKDSVLNVVVYSSAMDAIGAGSGELLTFRLLLGDQPKDYTLSPTKLTLLGSNGTELQGSTSTGTVSVRGAKAQYGAMTIDWKRVGVNSGQNGYLSISNVGNEPLVITALNFTDAVFQNTTTLPLTVEPDGTSYIIIECNPVAAGRLEAEMTVVSNSVGTQNTILLKAQAHAVNELSLGGVSGNLGEVVTIPLNMKNMDDIIGFQLEIDLTDNIEYVENSFQLSDRKNDHQAEASIDGNILRLIGYSTGGKSFKGNDGEIGNFKVKLVGNQSVSLRLDKCKLSAVIDGQVTNVFSGSQSGYVSIQGPNIYASSTLDIGEVLINHKTTRSLTINNYGESPLVISDVTFSDDSFTLKDKLPLTIAKWNSKDLTVECLCDKVADISAVMQIFSNDPDQRLTSVTISGRAISPNYLTAETRNVTFEDDVPLQIDLHNYEPISGIQFDITSTDGYTIDPKEIVLEDRVKGLEVSVRQVNATTLRLVGYMNGDGIATGKGRLMTIILAPINQLSEGIHQLTVGNVVLGGKDLLNIYEGPEKQELTFSVGEVVLGDANGDGVVNAADIVAVIRYKKGNAPAGFVFKAADVNKDGKVDEQDVKAIEGIILRR